MANYFVCADCQTACQDVRPPVTEKNSLASFGAWPMLEVKRWASPLVDPECSGCVLCIIHTVVLYRPFVVHAVCKKKIPAFT